MVKSATLCATSACQRISPSTITRSFNPDDDETRAPVTVRIDDSVDGSYRESDLQVFRKKGWHIIHINARSLRNTLTDMIILTKKTNTSKIAVSETWLDDTMTNNDINVPVCNIVRKDRDQYGGGVCIFVRDILPFNARNNLLEEICVELFLKKTKPIVVGCVYRPPTKLNFLEEFKGVLSKKELII